MIYGNSSDFPYCAGFSISFMTCGDYVETEDLTDDPDDKKWKRGFLGWSNAPVPPPNKHTCFACFASDKNSNVGSGDMGVGVCYNSSDQFVTYGTIESTGEGKFKAYTHNGFDSEFKDY